MKRRVAILLWLAMFWVSPNIASDDGVAKPAKRDTQPAIELTIDYGDGAQKRFPQVPWKKGMTVMDTLLWAENHPHGVQVRHRGKKSLAMVSQIDDLKNSGGSGKNWIFYVNDKLSDRSCGASIVTSGDKILWRFEVYR